MLESLMRIEAHGCSKLGVVVHLGAGLCRELEEYLLFEPDKVILVEANRDLGDQLRLRVRALEKVEVITAAVAKAEGKATLHVLNNARESSLLPPADLLNHYPNLALTRSVSVPAITLSRLVEGLTLDDSSENLLALELQGAELSVLSCVPPELLQRFTWIVVRASREVLYEGGVRLRDVDAALQGLGFRAVPHLQIGTVVPFQDALYRRDEELVQLQALDSQLRERERTIESLRQLLEEQVGRVARLEGEKASFAQSTASLESQLAKVERAHEEQARLAAGRGNDLERVSQEQDEHMKVVGEQRARIAVLEGDNDSLLQQVASLEGEVTRLGRAHDEQARMAEERRVELERVAQEQDEQTKVVGEQRARIAALEGEKNWLLQQVASLEHEVTRLGRAHDEQARMAEERRVELERVAQEQDEQTKVVGEQRAQLEVLARACDAQGDIATELRSQLERVTKERDEHWTWHLEHTNWAESLKQQNEALQRERDEHVTLAGELRKQVEELTKGREETANEFAASQQKITQIEQARNELEYRQRLLDEELVKAEAQIDLIKDVVLREKAF